MQAGTRGSFGFCLDAQEHLAGHDEVGGHDHRRVHGGSS